MRALLTGTVLLAAIGAFTACGSVESKADDAGPSPFDAAAASDAAQTIDAAPTTPDARPPVESPPATEVTSGGARTSGSIYNMDVQIGHPFGQGKSSGGGKTLEGAAAVKQ